MNQKNSQFKTGHNTQSNYNTTGRIQDALQFIDPADRETWWRMGMAIKSELGESGFDHWIEWSQTDKSFNARDAQSVWRGIKQTGSVTIGSLFYEARANGWRDNTGYQSPTPEEIAEQQRRRHEREEVERLQIEVMKPIRKAAFDNVLRLSVPLSESPTGKAYLQNRGLGELLLRNDLPEGWLSVSSLRYQLSNMAFPALVAPVLNLAGEVVNVHQTFLSEDGRKAPVNEAKLLMPSLVPGAMNGAAIRLYKAGYTLAIAEGIETALAVRVMRPDLPVWATVSAGGMASLRLPGSVCNVLIMADLDKSETGQNAALVLHSRLKKEGRAVQIHTPNISIPEGCKGVDWLDMLNREMCA